MKKALLFALVLFVFSVQAILAAIFSDGFDGSSLSGSWNSGSWGGGGYTPTVASSIVTLPGGGGGWIRTNATYTYAILEAQAEFGAGAYQHIGFADDGFQNDYVIFSTYNGDGNLYARVNNNNVGEARHNLGAIPTGMHTYRIEWLPGGAFDQVNFYIDGTFKAQFNSMAAGTTNLYAYISNNGAADLRVDSISIDDNPTATATPTPTSTGTPTATFTPTPTNTPSGPTPTATNTPDAPTPTPTFLPPPVGTPTEGELSGQVMATLEMPYDFTPINLTPAPGGATDVVGAIGLGNLIVDVSFLNELGSIVVTVWTILDNFAGGGVLAIFVIILLAVVVLRWVASFVYNKPISEKLDGGAVADVAGDLDPELGRQTRKFIRAVKNRPRF